MKLRWSVSFCALCLVLAAVFCVVLVTPGLAVDNCDHYENSRAAIIEGIPCCAFTGGGCWDCYSLPQPP